ncbi:MAG: Uma2 family endonuclease [Proteobacteria bacterium]|nr:Uma2 family endonuclease [Pseudomonadota bacterium]
MQPAMPAVHPIKNQPLKRYTRAEYDALVERGAFEDQRVELVFGQVVAMSPIGVGHSEATVTLARLLTLQLRARARVCAQGPFGASDESEPEPDLSVTPPGSYWTAHPTRAYLIVEVARSSLSYDRDEKATLYALSDVDEYWVVDLVHELADLLLPLPDGGEALV